MPGRVDASQLIPIVLEPQEHEKSLIQGIARLISTHSGEMGTESIYHGCMALLHLLFARSDIIWKAPLPGPLEALLQFIDLHAQEAMPNQRLAKQAGMSVASLCRTFRVYMHTTPANYVNQVRISKAGYLLEHTELSIEEIAASTGFPNRAYFSRVFKKVSSLSPAVFRSRKAIHRCQHRQ